jgi:hypothetical protein
MVSLNIPAFEGVDLKKTVEHDFNFDRKSDVLWRDANSGLAAIWLVDATHVSNSSALSPNLGTDWKIAGVGDFNNDGRADILWRQTSTGNIAIWLMNTFTVIGGATFGNPGGTWQIVGVGDFNTDGKADILWRDAAGQTAIWFMNGLTVADSLLVNMTMPTSWVVSAVADFDNSGAVSILWRNTAPPPHDGEQKMWLMKGATVVREANLLKVDLAWKVLDTGDFNLDGKRDLLWWNDSTKQTAVWLLDGAVILKFVLLPQVQEPEKNLWQPVAAGDYNGDGVADILWRKTDGHLANWLISKDVTVLGFGALGEATLNWETK